MKTSDELNEEIIEKFYELLNLKNERALCRGDVSKWSELSTKIEALIAESLELIEAVKKRKVS